MATDEANIRFSKFCGILCADEHTDERRETHN